MGSNVRDDRVGWVAALTRLVTPYKEDTPRQSSGVWRRLFPAKGFSPLRESRFSYSHRGPAEEVILNRTLSISFIAVLPPSERQKVEAAIQDLIVSTPAIAGPGDVTFPYETRAYDCTRLADGEPCSADS